MYCGIVQLLDACTTRLDLSSAARRLFSLDGDEVCFVLLETFSIRQTANCKPQLRVYCFALPRFHSLARLSVQFSSFLFGQNIIQYKNTYRNCKVAMEPRRNQKAL